MQKLTFWLIGFCVSTLSSTLWSALPSLFLCLLFLAISSASLITLKRPVYACLPSYRLKRFQLNNSLLIMFLITLHGAASGTAWMASVGHWYTSWQLQVSNFKNEVMLVGDVLSVSAEGDYGKLTLKVDYVNGKPTIVSPNVLLYWRDLDIRLRRHQQIKLLTKLKPANGMVNPGSAVKEQWLLSQGVVATGYISKAGKVDLLTPTISFHSKVTEFLNQSHFTNARWLKAILIGNRDDLTSEDWDMLQITGAAHLFSISGLHMGIIFVWCYSSLAAFIVLWQKFFFNHTPRLNLSKYLHWPLIFLTGSYAIFATAALPVVRAWMLISLYLILQNFHANWSRLHKSLCMIAACIICFPLSIYSASFYLSAGAVLIIWFLLWRIIFISPTYLNKLKQLILMQFCLCWLMLPITLLWFGQISWIAPLTNLLMVPIISLVLPLFIFALIADYYFKFGAGGLLSLADDIMGWVVETMTFISNYTVTNTMPSLPNSVSYFVLVAVFLILCPSFSYKRLLITLCFIPLSTSLIPPSKSSWKLHVFDVGQGTAMAISTGSKAILFDTGPAYDERFSTMKQIVIPALQALKINHVDMLFISHSDNDHAGGINDFKTFFDKYERQNTRIYSTDTGCLAGKEWRWEGLNIRAIWPGSTTDSGNNFSCVLKISDSHFSILVPGDIESSAEYELLYQAQDLRSDVLISPHHGSATSSTDIFVKTVAPQLVIHTAGFMNRWGFPDETVVARYTKIGARQLITGKQGYVQTTFSENKLEVRTYREYFENRWYLQQINQSRPFHVPLMY